MIEEGTERDCEGIIAGGHAKSLKRLQRKELWTARNPLSNTPNGWRKWKDYLNPISKVNKRVGEFTVYNRQSRVGL